MVFDNPVGKVKTMLDAMSKTSSMPEFECFDVGIVRSVGLYVENRMATHPDYNYVMGVASGMPPDPDLLALLRRYSRPECTWQVTAMGRAEVWPLHRRAAELGGALRTGLEDTFYLPDGNRAKSNGELIDAMTRMAHECGRHPASPAEARTMLRLAA
jgi:uncharacterized protein (DUF849 family)